MISAESDIVLAAIRAGRPVAFGSRLLVAKTRMASAPIQDEGILLFAEVNHRDGIEDEVTCWMTLPALAFAIETGSARLAPDSLMLAGYSA